MLSFAANLSVKLLKSAYSSLICICANARLIKRALSAQYISVHLNYDDDPPCCPSDLSWPSAIRSGCFLEDSTHCSIRYSTSAGQGGNLIKACLLCSLTCANFHVCPADQSPSVLWHTRSVSQSNTNIDNQAEPISSVLKDYDEAKWKSPLFWLSGLLLQSFDPFILPSTL